MDDDIMYLITAETNKYGNAKLPQLGKRSLKPTTKKWVALDGHSIMSSIMTRRRFEGLLRFLHLVDNSENANGDRLFNISHLFGAVERAMHEVLRSVCID
ncbi:unnamed protein product [Haemonchus placei]|uniref:PiggyBac transposable element-derived protein domain-containing protein n=1 Tax=Haemonchus placei TaxID=6290 RepID=A0A3P7ZRA3_HAEPC|nr:unnamed protein product [Haemonchus placei]